MVIKEKLGVNVKFKNKKLSTSSKEYLRRQEKDIYTTMARKDGYASRAAYKLLEMNEKHKFLGRNQTVVDLGAAPGGWSQVLSKTLGDKSKIFALDVLDMNAIGGVHFIKGDFTQDAVLEELLAVCSSTDVVISDMAPSTIGHKSTDALASLYLCEIAADFAIKTLKPGGTFLCKLFQGGGEVAFRKMLLEHFEKVLFEKPPSSRKDSVEMFILAKNFKG